MCSLSKHAQIKADNDEVRVVVEERQRPSMMAPLSNVLILGQMTHSLSYQRRTHTCLTLDEFNEGKIQSYFPVDARVSH